MVFFGVYQFFTTLWPVLNKKRTWKFSDFIPTFRVGGWKWKNMLVKMGSSSPNRGENKKIFETTWKAKCPIFLFQHGNMSMAIESSGVCLHRLTPGKPLSRDEYLKPPSFLFLKASNPQPFPKHSPQTFATDRPAFYGPNLSAMFQSTLNKRNNRGLSPPWFAL